MYRKIIVFIMSLLVIMLTACGKNTYPVLDVKLELKGSSEVQYAEIYEDGSTANIDEVIATDDAEVFIADVNNFSANTESGKVVNELISTVVMDGDGNEVEADEALSKLLQTIAESVGHDILEAKIFKDGQMYYIAVQTNVNWQSPCDKVHAIFINMIRVMENLQVSAVGMM